MWLVIVSTVIWIAVLLLPWRPWSTRERLFLTDDSPSLDNVTVLIPARNEAVCIGETLRGIDAQGIFRAVIVIDDQSDDGTGDAARRSGLDNLRVIDGVEPPAGWSGKLWALAQGFEHCDTEFVLLLDADIGLEPRVATSLLSKLQSHDLDMASVMANLYMGNRWERLLLPPFIYFFKLIYPFALANAPASRIAAGAGGCVLLRSAALRAIGGFASLRGAIIDDCTLAKRIKLLPGRIWIGLSNDVRAVRPYETLSNIWNMVARTAYTQLRYSPLLLAVCTALLVITYIVPVVAVFGAAKWPALVALAAMAVTYYPTIRFYELPPMWVVTLPVAAVLFLGMTWTSAIRYYRGERSRWKNRTYVRDSAVSRVAE